MFKCSRKCYNLKHQPAKTHKTRTMEQLNGTKQKDFFFSLLSIVKCCWQAQTQIISTIIGYLLHWLHERWSPFNQLIISHENPQHYKLKAMVIQDPFTSSKTMNEPQSNCRLFLCVKMKIVMGHLDFTLNILQVFSFPHTA